MGCGSADRFPLKLLGFICSRFLLTKICSPSDHYLIILLKIQCKALLVQSRWSKVLGGLDGLVLKESLFPVSTLLQTIPVLLFAARRKKRIISDCQSLSSWF